MKESGESRKSPGDPETDPEVVAARAGPRSRIRALPPFQTPPVGAPHHLSDATLVPATVRPLPEVAHHVEEAGVPRTCSTSPTSAASTVLRLGRSDGPRRELPLDRHELLVRQQWITDPARATRARRGPACSGHLVGQGADQEIDSPAGRRARSTTLPKVCFGWRSGRAEHRCPALHIRSDARPCHRGAAVGTRLPVGWLRPEAHRHVAGIPVHSSGVSR